MFPHNGGPWDRIKYDVMFGRVRQVAAPVGRRGRSMVSPIASSTYETQNSFRISPDNDDDDDDDDNNNNKN